MDVVNLLQKFDLFTEQWTPKVVGELNGQLVKLAKLEGEFHWHSHADEDEMFYVVKGTLQIELRDRTLELQPGEFTIIPRGVEHKPVATEEAWIMLFEPASTLNTGEARNDRTITDLEHI